MPALEAYQITALFGFGGLAFCVGIILWMAWEEWKEHRG